MFVPKRWYSRLISSDAESALRKLVENERLNWLFFILSNQGYVEIIDIDYENGRPFNFDEGLKILNDHLTKPITEYGLSDQECNDYQELLVNCGIVDGEGKIKIHSNDIIRLLEKVDRGYQLTTYESDEITSVSSLDLWDCQISKLPKSIGHLTSLKALGIGRNRIEELPEDVWQLRKLQKIDLSWTKVKAIPKSIKQLQDLKELYINGTLIKTLPEEIGEMPNLQKMEINDTKISQLPLSLSVNNNLPIIYEWSGDKAGIYAKDTNISKGFSYRNSEFFLHLLQKIDNGYQPTDKELFHISNLETFQLNGTLISSLPNSIGLMKALKVLELRDTSIKELPTSIGQLAILEALDLFGSMITALPDSVGNLSLLQKLGLSSTQIKTVPNAIKRLGNLKELFLRGTQITSLPSWICEMTNLQRIDLDDTAITSIPENIGNLTRLQHLSLSGTKIEILPDSIGSLKNLQTLNLYKTKISALPEYVTQLPSLRELDLRRTLISSLPESMGQLANLQTLSLGGTVISSLPESVGRLQNLESLGISNTRLDRLPDWLGEIPNLRHLNMMGLTIPTIPKSIALCGLTFVQKRNFRNFEDGVNLYNIHLKEQDISIFLNHPELLSDFYKEESGLIAKEATALIMNAIDNDTTGLRSYGKFLEYVNNNKTIQMLPYLSKEFSFLFVVEENGTDLKAAYRKELQDVLYQMFLLDCGKAIHPMEEVYAGIEDKRSTTAQINNNQHNQTEKKHESKDHMDASLFTTPSDLERATEIVLIEFVKWLSDERKRQGLSFQILIPPHRQSSGLQYGYDVGIGTAENHNRFNICFECKHYKTNKKDSDDEKQAILKVNSYSYNLLQYYMHCNKEMNNRWILVSTYGDLQNDFPQKLFENWNSDHVFLKIFAITESTIISCKDFLATSEEAYKMVYGELPSGKLKTRDEVFKWLNKNVIGKDWIEENIQQRLRYSTLPLPGRYRCRDTHTPLLQIRDKNNNNALTKTLEYIAKIDVPYGIEQYPSMYGVYIIGEYGTGKTWLACQTIEEIIRHPGDYPFEPFYFELKGIVDNIKEDMPNNQEVKDVAYKFVDNKLKPDVLKAASSQNVSIFFLDGFDEALSGLSFTDIKISLLYKIIEAIRNVLPASLFVVTSRESDYEACKKHKAFEHLIKYFYEVRLNDCTGEQVKNNITEMAKQPNKDAVRLMQLLQNESIVNIIRRPVFFSMVSCIAEREEFARNCDEVLDEYDVLKEVVNNELRKMRNCKQRESELYHYAVEATCNPEKVLQVSIGLQEQLVDDTIAKIIPIGIFDIIANNGKPTIEFKHNIIREFLVAKYLYSLLVLCVMPQENENICNERFINEMQKTPLNVAMQRFFVEGMKKDNKYGEIAKNRLLGFLQDSHIKGNKALATKLLEILLLPGSRLHGTGKPLDLTKIQVKSLYLWDCVLENIDFRNSTFDSLQLINAELVSVKLQGATIRDLKLCSDLKIIGLARWQESNIWYIVLLLGDGQLLKYAIHDQFDSGCINVRLLEKPKMSQLRGLFILKPDLYLFDDNVIYSHLQKKLYVLKSGEKLLQIKPIGSSTNYLVEIDRSVYALSFTDGSIPTCYHIGKVNDFYINSFCFVESSLFLYIQRGALVLQNDKQKRSVCDLDDNNICFGALCNNRDYIKVYFLSEEKIQILSIFTRTGKVWETRTIQLEEPIQDIKHVEPLSDSVLLVTDESRVYLMKINGNRCEAMELSAGVRCQGLELGDGINETRVEDDKAYFLLKSINSYE